MKKGIAFFLILIALGFSLFFHNPIYSLAGLAARDANPPGNVKNSSGELSINPAQLTFGLSDTQKTVTVLVTDPFVFKDVYICKKPCNALTDWSKIGEFDSGIRISDTNYFDARTGITKSFVIQKDIVNPGNNFVAIFTCKGVGLCNENKWLFEKFQVQFIEPIVPLSCNLKTACATGETDILEIADITNAFLAIAGKGLAQKVCCSSGTSVITVGSGDTIFYLDNENNAHGFAIQNRPFPIKISLPNSKIRCVAAQQSCDSIGFDTCILSLTSLQDAYGGSCTSHSNKICCSRLDISNLCAGKQNGFSCDAGKVCSNGQCLSGQCNPACSAGQICNPATNGCVGCLNNLNCISGQICSNNNCVECLTNTDCASGYCTAGKCVGPPLKIISPANDGDILTITTPTIKVAVNPSSGISVGGYYLNISVDNIPDNRIYSVVQTDIPISPILCNGQHTVKVELTDVNRLSLSPPITATRTFNANAPMTLPAGLIFSLPSSGSLIDAVGGKQPIVEGTQKIESVTINGKQLSALRFDSTWGMTYDVDSVINKQQGTVSFWVYIKSGTFPLMYIARNLGPTYRNQLGGILALRSDGGFGFTSNFDGRETTNPGAGGTFYTTSPLAYFSGWHHVAFSWTQSPNSVLMHIDGKPITPNFSPTNIFYFPPVISYIVFGTKSPGTPISAPSGYDGYIANYRLYNSALNTVAINAVACNLP